LDLTQGIQSALNAHGPHAEAVATLSWVMFYGAAAVFLVVLVAAALALWGPSRLRARIHSDRSIVYGGIVFPSVILVALFVYSLALTRSFVTGAGPADLRIEVVAHQWWWRVTYLDPTGGVDFVTANEIQLPTDAAVELIVKTADVIHSFWVPTLAGKLDMIPGHVNRLRVVASSEGLFRGQCAEYCGGPHAQMAFYVIAQPQPAFEQWRDSQRAPATEISDGTATRGRELFMGHCSVCHTVRGTLAQGTLGPDLTHVGSRRSLAAGILANNRANLAAWIASSQHIKPGNLMPSMEMFSGDDLRALVAYLTALR
jgi:cytochrome c oxidase subunit 2